MSYNVELTDDGDRATVEAVGATQGDVVCLQEVTPAWETVLRARYADDYAYMLFKPDSGAGGLAVLSKWPVIDQGLRPGPGSWHPAWHVIVHTPGGPVQILNVHLRPVFSGRGDPFESYARAEEDHAAQIEQYSDDCLAELPTLVVGDFNEGPDGAAVRHLEGQGYRNALPLFRPGQETWRHRSLGGQLGDTLDHVLFGTHFEPLNAYVVVAGNSDHIPVVARVELAP